MIVILSTIIDPQHYNHQIILNFNKIRPYLSYMYLFIIICIYLQLYVFIYVPLNVDIFTEFSLNCHGI